MIKIKRSTEVLIIILAAAVLTSVLSYDKELGTLLGSLVIFLDVILLLKHNIGNLAINLTLWLFSLLSVAYVIIVGTNLKRIILMQLVIFIYLIATEKFYKVDKR